MRSNAAVILVLYDFFDFSVSGTCDNSIHCISACLLQPRFGGKRKRPLIFNTSIILGTAVFYVAGHCLYGFIGNRVGGLF